jgi:hypothetical protein
MGGASRDRTDGLLDANQALSPLSYGPNTLKDVGREPNNRQKSGGVRRDRTVNLGDANAALSQLSYDPGN